MKMWGVVKSFREFERKAKELKELEKELGSLDKECFGSEIEMVERTKYNEENKKIDLERIPDVRSALEGLKREIEEREITPLSISISKEHESIESGKQSKIVVNVAYKDSQMSDAEVVLSPKSGKLSPESVKTDEKGAFVSEYTAPAVTSEEKDEIKVSVSKSCYKGAESSSIITVLPPPQPITIERTIWDPYNNKFIISPQRDLPQVREWIKQHNPSAYWFIASVRNNTNEDIRGWGVELEMKPSLRVEQALIKGIEGDKKVEIPTERPSWESKKYGAGVSSDSGIIISPKTPQQFYFKLRSDRPKTDYTINGVFKCANFGPIPIKPKSFTFWCDTVILTDAMETNPEVANDCVKTELERRFAKTDAERLANSFRIILDIRNNCCNRNTKVGDVISKYDDLKKFLEQDFIDAIEEDKYLGGLIQEMNVVLWGEDAYLDDANVKKLENFCVKFVEKWIARFLR